MDHWDNALDANEVIKDNINKSALWYSNLLFFKKIFWLKTW